MITTLDKNTALVLIDLQKGIAGYPLIHPIEAILENANRLITAFRKAGLPIAFVNVKPVAQHIRKDAPSHSVNFNEDWYQICDELSQQEGDIYITKHTWNAFTNPALHEMLRERNVTGIVLAGISTSIGVEGTARAANELGYQIAFALDAITDMNAEAHNHSSGLIFPRIGESGVTSDIIESLFNFLNF